MFKTVFIQVFIRRHSVGHFIWYLLIWMHCQIQRWNCCNFLDRDSKWIEWNFVQSSFEIGAISLYWFYFVNGNVAHEDNKVLVKLSWNPINWITFTWSSDKIPRILLLVSISVDVLPTNAVTTRIFVAVCIIANGFFFVQAAEMQILYHLCSDKELSKQKPIQSMNMAKVAIIYDKCIKWWFKHWAIRWKRLILMLKMFWIHSSAFKKNNKKTDFRNLESNWNLIECTTHFTAGKQINWYFVVINAPKFNQKKNLFAY